MSVWVPYTCADQLLGALRQHQDDRMHVQVSATAQQTDWIGLKTTFVKRLYS